MSFGQGKGAAQKIHFATAPPVMCALNKIYVYNSRRYRKYGPIFTIMLGTRMRIGEVLGLTEDDIDFDNNIYKKEI